MPRVLPSVLSRRDLPEAELYAAKLDGELFAIDEGFGPIDAVEFAHHRGMSLLAILPPRLIAEQRTAAWVHGALPQPPGRHQLCADSAARYRCLGMPRIAVREVVIGPTETVERGGLRVTTALRTAIDLARFSEPFGDADARIVAELALIGRFTLEAALADLDGRPHLHGKIRAAARLRSALDGPIASER